MQNLAYLIVFYCIPSLQYRSGILDNLNMVGNEGASIDFIHRVIHRLIQHSTDKSLIRTASKVYNNELSCCHYALSYGIYFFERTY